MMRRLNFLLCLDLIPELSKDFVLILVFVYFLVCMYIALLLSVKTSPLSPDGVIISKLNGRSCYCFVLYLCYFYR